MDFSKIDHKDVWVRAGKTFVQAALAALLLNSGKVDKSAVIGALAAGISAVWNYLNEVK